MYYVFPNTKYFTFAVSDATPRPDTGFTANADVIHCVIVSGAVAVIVAVPSALEIKGRSFCREMQ